MAYLVREESDEPEPEYPAVYLLMVNGEFFSHSAAQFWPSLIEEVLAAYPHCTLLELVAPSAHPLGRHLLDPCARLQSDIERFRNDDIIGLIAETVAELELLGGPSTVRLRLRDGDQGFYDNPMPPECIDSEILSYLVSWLLEWAGIDEERWNDEFVGGHVSADAPLNERAYSIDFGLRRRHLGEDLYEIKLELLPVVSVEGLSAPACE